jgi:DNA-binding response OmpR family regulator
LPGLSGIELLRLLAADIILRRTPVVICSGAEDLTRVYGPELANLGCEVIRKPFKLEELIGSVRRAVWSSQSSW